MRSVRTATALLCLAGSLGLAAPGSADWLVTRQGGRVETKGHWAVKGKLVVFTRPDGTLSSLRASDVDIAASEQATADAVVAAAKAAEEPEAKPAEKKKKSVFVVTDETLKKTPPPDKAEGAADGKPAANSADTAAAAKPGASPLVVDQWKQVPRSEGDGVEVFGTVRNNGSDPAADLGVEVKLFDEKGKLLANADATISAPELTPGGSANFHVSFPGIFLFARAEFATKARALKPEPQTTEEKPKAKPPG